MITGEELAEMNWIERQFIYDKRSKKLDKLFAHPSFKDNNDLFQLCSLASWTLHSVVKGVDKNRRALIGENPLSFKAIADYLNIIDQQIATLEETLKNQY